MRGRLPQIASALAALAVALLAGCGGGEETGDGLASFAPPDAPLYAEFTVRPNDEQAGAIESLTDQVAGIADPGAAIVSELDSSLDEVGLTYADDVEPWLGEHGALFVRSFETGASGVPEFAAMLEVEDADAANDFLDHLAKEPSTEGTRSYGGFDYLYGTDGKNFAVGLVDDTLVIGTEASFKVAVDARDGESLGASDDYTREAEALGDDSLAIVFLDPATVVDAAMASREISPADAEMIRPLLAGTLTAPISAGLRIGDGAISLDVVASAEDGLAEADADQLGELPGSSALAVAVPQLGEMLETRIDQLENSGLPGVGSLREMIKRRTGLDLSADVTSWLGEVSAFMSGSPSANFAIGVIASTSESEGPQRLIRVLRAVVAREEPDAPIGGPPERAEAGFTVGVPVIGPQAGIGLFGDQLVATLRLAPQQALDPKERLADEETYRAALDALGDEFAPVLYANLPALLPFAQAGGADEGRDYSEAGPYLDALRYLITGVREDDGLSVVRFNFASP